MPYMKKSIIFCFAICLFLPIAVRAEFYLFTDLGTYGSYTYLGASGINSKGDVVGTSYESSGRPVAFRHSAGAFSGIISPGPSHSTWGNAINDAGTVVGLCDRTGHPLGNVTHAFYASPAGSAVDFDSNFTRNSEAKAINESGYVVGSLTGQSFLGHTSGWIMPLGPILGNDFAARDLNNNFVVVGNGFWGGMTYNALSGAITYLGFDLGNWTNRAAAINDAGVITGKVGAQGFLDAGGSVTLFGSAVAEVMGINATADVVGSTTNEHAFVYLKSSGHFLDLNTVVASSVSTVWTLTVASGINDKGVICGQARRLATLADGPGYGIYVYRAFKLTPFILIHFPPPFLTAE
jgi:probable HAF family extracellular repeat protein